MFDENTLREEIVRTWGPAGAHIEVLDKLMEQAAMLRRVEHSLVWIVDNLDDSPQSVLTSLKHIASEIRTARNL